MIHEEKQEYVILQSKPKLAVEGQKDGGNVNPDGSGKTKGGG